jgi:sugar diacid utilization regulator/putative methionine-R-sulfoxide reductase with GAF domain
LALEHARSDTPRPAGHPDAGLESAIALIARLAGVDACAVAWRDLHGDPRTVAVGSDALEEWAAAQLARDGAGSRRDTLVVPLAGGLLAVEGSTDAVAEHVLAACVEHLQALLDISLRDGERMTAYKALIEVSAQLHAQELNTDELLGLIVRQARQLMEVDVTWLAMIDEERQRVVVKVASGARTESFVRMWVGVGVGVGGLAVRDRRSVVVRDHRHFDHPTTDLVKRTLEAEGVVSLLCVPMIFEGGAVGALYGGSRTPTDFSRTAVSVFTALAGQAVVSIANSRLYRDLAMKNDTLERTFALHHSLSEAALTGGGMDGIAGRLAELIDREVVVWRSDCPSAGTPPPAEERSVGILAGEERLGSLHAKGSEPLSDLQHHALQQAATVMALEILKERRALEAEWRLRGELLDEIVGADGEWSEGLLLRSERFGVDLELRRCLAVLEPVDADQIADLQHVIRTSFHRALGDGTALVSKHGDRILVALAQDAEEAFAAVQTVLHKARKAGAPAAAGLSTPRRNLAVALKEATAALALARHAKTDEPVSHDSLGPLRFLLDAPDTHEMTALVVDLLGPVADYDRHRGSREILETLRVYVELGGNGPGVADRCHIHVSTVKYRMRKAAELLGRSLSEPQTRFELTLAFRLHDVLGTLGLDPLRK